MFPNLSLSNLLQTHPSPDFIFAPYAFAIVALLFLGSFLIEYCRKNVIKDDIILKSTKGAASAARWIACLAPVMIWFRLEGFPYVSMRIWWFAVLFLFLYFFGFNIWSKYKKFKTKKQKYVKSEVASKLQKKYLPKKKNKKRK